MLSFCLLDSTFNPAISLVVFVFTFYLHAAQLILSLGVFFYTNFSLFLLVKLIQSTQIRVIISR